MGILTMPKKWNSDLIFIEFGDGRIMSWPGKKLPFVYTGDGMYEAKLAAGDLCG